MGQQEEDISEKPLAEEDREREKITLVGKEENLRRPARKTAATGVAKRGTDKVQQNLCRRDAQSKQWAFPRPTLGTKDPGQKSFLQAFALFKNPDNRT